MSMMELFANSHYFVVFDLKFVITVDLTELCRRNFHASILNLVAFLEIALFGKEKKIISS